MITKIQAIISLVPGAQVTIQDNVIEWHSPSAAPVTDAQIEAEMVRLQAEYNAKQYQRSRAAEYPSFAEQFDTLYHGGYDAWKAQIDSVKLKYPKA
jgi:uncharacterized protein (DUF362 family)